MVEESNPGLAARSPPPPEPEHPPAHGASSVERPTGGVIDGRALATAWKDEVAAKVAHLRRFGARPPGLAVVLLGNRPDSVLYVQRKEEAAREVGFDFRVERLPEAVTQGEVLATVRRLCRDPAVDGVLVQLPLPPHIDEEAVMEAFDPRKDVDGFHPVNVGRLVMRGRSSLHVPCTPLGCLEMLRRSGVDVRGSHAVIVGDSNIVGTPLSMLLRDAGAAAVTVCHRVSTPAQPIEGFHAQEAERRAQAGVCLPRTPGPRLAPRLHGSPRAVPRPAAAGLAGDTDYPSIAMAAPRKKHDMEDAGTSRAGFARDLPRITAQADILVVAIGEPELVRGDWVKPGAVVLDVGINVVPPETEGGSTESAHHHIVGDVAFAEVSRVASLISPVPGGVGPMTIAALLSNTLESAQLAMGLADMEGW